MAVRQRIALLGDTADDFRLSAVEMQGSSIVDVLPEVHQFCLDRALPVEGEFALEVFAGECTLTLALLMCRVP